MYFPHAFRKSYLLGANGLGGGSTLTLLASGTTSALAAGQIGVFDAKDFTNKVGSPSGVTTNFIVAGGSW